MGKPRGFLEIKRTKNPQRPVSERVDDFKEFELPLADTELKDQSARCMDCGIPFCHWGCPLGNLIPEFNDLVLAGRWEAAAQSIHATNNFPEITGRVCPAPCEASCVLNIDNTPVTIKLIEKSIADEIFERDWLKPQIASRYSGKTVAVVGSGPAGMACAQQLARLGHAVTLFEKADRIGGLVRYGIPDFKLEKDIIDRRMEQMRAEGVKFAVNTNVGVDIVGEHLSRDFDAIVLCGGAMVARDLNVPGRELAGVHFALELLQQQNKINAGDSIANAITARGKHVIVLGGGDTGSDCVGTSNRHGAASVTSLELLPKPPSERRSSNPWPQWPYIFRTSSSHDEGGERDFGVMTKELVGTPDGKVRALKAVHVNFVNGKFEEVAGSEFELPADLVLLAMGFVGSAKSGIIEQLGVAMDARGNVATTKNHQTNNAKVFAAGDMSRGQSLVVWAIAEGRKAADAVDQFLAQKP